MIELSNVSRIYRMGDATVSALHGISSHDRARRVRGDHGPVRLRQVHADARVGLLDRPDSGSYRLMGREVAGLSEDELAVLRSRSVGFVFQQFHLLSRTTARENVAMPLLYSHGQHGHGRARRSCFATSAWRAACVTSRTSCPAASSSAWRSRASLINDPELILADEPTGNLDSASAEEIMAVLSELHRRGKTVILVTHEADIAAYAERIIHLRDGVVLSDEQSSATGGLA